MTKVEKSGFFGSVSGDRIYKAEDWANYFSKLVTNGIFPMPSTNLQVMANNDMTVTVKAGAAWINGYFYENTEDLDLSIDVADSVLNRIDRIVVKYDTAAREIKAVIKKGALASNPVAPTLQRDADAYEIALADITVTAGAGSIAQAVINDLRLNTSLCGIVNSLIQADTTTLLIQYESGMQTKTTEFENSFITWFEGIQDALGEDVAGQLLNLINQNAADINNHRDIAATLNELGHVKHGKFTVTIDTSWTGSSAPFSKTLTVTGILATDTPIVDVVMSGTYATDDARQKAWSKIYRIVTDNNQITLYATVKPTVSLPIQLKVVR